MSTATSTAAAAPIEALSPWRESWRVFRSNKAAIVGLVLLSLAVLAMSFGPALYGVAPFDIVAAPFTPPFENPQVWLGTDYLGRDVVPSRASHRNSMPARARRRLWSSPTERTTPAF